MNILLTGGTGYIGSHVAVVFAELGHDVVLYDNLSNSTAAVANHIGEIVGRSCSFVCGDIRDTDLLQATLREYQIDAVVHLAGLKAVGESVEKPVEYYANNVTGTISLLEAMKAESVKTLVFSSSATVYGKPQYLPIDESHPTSATNPYGRSKLHIEEMLSDLAASDPEWHIACLRYFNPVGAHETALLGEKPSGKPNNLVPFIAQVAAGTRAILSVFGDDYDTPDGTGLRDYIHVMDLAEGHAMALRFLGSNAGWHAINLGTGQAYSVLQMIKFFENASGRKVTFEVMPRRLGDVASCYANPKKARELLGWTASRTLDEMCSSTWRFQQAVDKANV
ncbi:UDP-glucose 4-epimerase GalE [Agrobacterium tumefaciens]|uniref:UDP-glucose 4-epimerase GalE n=1 Tax=Agrobacterium tumefaciens TaxID=358 RepID=UPI00287F0EA5|nr:UDP-glucose 4-epimerase GalE [Agrobacterium tumefaciens]MDS7594754.1 UDP-glucose 4-epimerase GalE [Agrobacterium tumefaciens]